MKVKRLWADANTPIVIEPTIYSDDRGYFFESFNEKDFIENVCETKFVQDNESKSSRGVLRGLHFQKPPFDQSKLVRVVNGAVFDVAVDIRKGSPTYGKWVGQYLSEENHKQFFIPRGFAHGFLALRDNTIFQYKCDNIYNKDSEGAIAYDDKSIGICWDEWLPYSSYKLSNKDMFNPLLNDFESPFVYE